MARNLAFDGSRTLRFSYRLFGQLPKHSRNIASVTTSKLSILKFLGLTKAEVRLPEFVYLPS
jgi:hypothetical protein